MSLLYKNDVGAKILISTGNTNLPGTDTLTLMVKKPSGATAEWAIGVGDSLDTATGIITYYTKLSTELSEAGDYTIQIRRITNAGKQTKSNVDNFNVKEGLF
jgi:predicted phage tail protein